MPDITIGDVTTFGFPPGTLVPINEDPKTVIPHKPMYHRESYSFLCTKCNGNCALHMWEDQRSDGWRGSTTEDVNIERSRRVTTTAACNKCNGSGVSKYPASKAAERYVIASDSWVQSVEAQILNDYITLPAF